MPWSKRLFAFWKLILDLTAWSAVFRPFIIYLVGKGEGRMLGKIIIFLGGKEVGRVIEKRLPLTHFGTQKCISDEILLLVGQYFRKQLFEVIKRVSLFNQCSRGI